MASSSSAVADSIQGYFPTVQCCQYFRKNKCFRQVCGLQELAEYLRDFSSAGSVYMHQCHWFHGMDHCFHLQQANSWYPITSQAVSSRIVVTRASSDIELQVMVRIVVRGGFRFKTVDDGVPNTDFLAKMCTIIFWDLGQGTPHPWIFLSHWCPNSTVWTWITILSLGKLHCSSQTNVPLGTVAANCMILKLHKLLALGWTLNGTQYLLSFSM